MRLPFARFTLVLLLLFFVGNVLYAQDGGALLSTSSSFTRSDTLRGTLSALRTWFDVTHYNLHITVNPDEKYLSGYNDIYFLVKDEGNKTMQLDLFANLQIDSILWHNKKLPYTREFNTFYVSFSENLPPKSVQQIRIYYSGSPTLAVNPPWNGGFVWQKDQNGKHWVGVACQGLGASVWYPNKDHQSDEPDSMRISCAVPKDLFCFANGQAAGIKPENDHYTRYDWRVTYPVNNYAASLNIGDYAVLNDFYVSKTLKDTLAIHYYVLSYNAEQAKAHFEQVKPMMACYEQFFGPYPFWNDGYAMVETPYLGMEHQSGIAYGNQYKKGYMGWDITGSGIGERFDYIVIHETGHEWWGNSVTSADIADMWIHESFCTYGESVYVECLYGKADAMKYVNGPKARIDNEAPMIGHYGVNKEGSGDMYAKGALMLNTMRHVIDNDELWWQIIKGIAQDFQYKTVTRDSIVTYFNRKSGKKLDAIFDQYLSYAKLPILEYKTQKRGKKLKVSYRWKANVPEFDMPLKYQKADGEWATIKPNTKEWQSFVLNDTISKDPVFDEESYYFESKKL